MLDNPKNDIFIHMDAKTKSYNPADTEVLVKHSRVIHTPRIKVSWGGYSQIEAELILLETATSQGHYERYHLLSGQDLPIKTQDDISAFFEGHHGVEFVNFQSETFGFEDRVRYYYSLQETVGRKRSSILWKVQKVGLILQKLLHVHRNKGVNFQKGTNWFSITDELARYTVSKREWIRKVFHDTLCCDEVFLQTLVINSQFIDNLYHHEFDDTHEGACARLIDWKRGSPYTFRMSDLQEIQNSPAMFARKFDEAVDADIVRKIQELYSR